MGLLAIWHNLLQFRKGAVIKSSKNAYVVDKLLGKGGFGAVYKVSVQGSLEKVYAMKVERKQDARLHSKLKMEIAVLQATQDAAPEKKKHFTYLVDRGKKEDFFFLIMELVGKSLGDLQKSCHKKVFPIGSGCIIAEQCLQALHDLHTLGFIHRDVKPSNFAVGKGEHAPIIFVLDFGISRRVLSGDGQLHTPRERCSFKGTIKFASLACHNREEQSYKDDVESWLYMCVELLAPNGLLWGKMCSVAAVQGAKFDSRNNMKSLFSGAFPKYFLMARVLDYIDSLRYIDDVDYEYIFDSLRKTCLENGGDMNETPCWLTIKEMRESNHDIRERERCAKDVKDLKDEGNEAREGREGSPSNKDIKDNKDPSWSSKAVNVKAHGTARHTAYGMVALELLEILDRLVLFGRRLQRPGADPPTPPPEKKKRVYTDYEMREIIRERERQKEKAVPKILEYLRKNRVSRSISMTDMSPNPIRVLVTGAAGQIGYSLVLQIAKGDVFGAETPIVLVLLDIPPMAAVLEGVQFELQDCALANLRGVEAVTTEKEAFHDIDYAFLVGAMPRKEGMERKDLLAANVKIFKSQGKALAEYAKPTTKVIVVGNPANTNAFICAKYAAPKIPTRNFSAMTRLDHNRATAQIAHRSGVTIGDVKNVIIWGNHSSTQFPDVKHAQVNKGGSSVDAYTAVNDQAWLHGDFITVVQKRGAEIIARRKLSSAMSAAKAACDHIHDWYFGTQPGEWVSMAVPSDGSYGIPEGLVFSFPVTICGESKEWKIVQGLELDDFAKSKIAITTKELEEERNEALAACEEANM